MTLSAEVCRIFAKDLRVLRWPLAGWVALLAVSVARGVGALPTLHRALFPVAVIVPITAAILVALTVQADPADPGPMFWGIHRQRPLAVSLAKVAMASLLLVLMAAGHALVLSTHGLTSDQLIALVAAAARDTGAWFLFAAALAACARDAKGWLTGGVLVGVLALLLSVIIADHRSVLEAWPLTHASASLLLAVVSVSMIAWAYRAHLTGMRAGVRTAVLFVIAALVLVTPRDSMARPVDDRTVRPDSATIIDTAGIESRIEHGAVVVNVPVTYPDSSLVVATTVGWRLQLRDGSNIDLLPNGVSVRRTAAQLKPEEHIASWGRGRVSRILKFRYPLDSATMLRVASSLASVSMQLQVERVAMRRVASMSAKEGGTLAYEGTRFHLDGVQDHARFETTFSHVDLPKVRRTPWTVWFASIPIFVFMPVDSGAMRMLEFELHSRNGDFFRRGGWVLPGNEMQGAAGMLSADGEPLEDGGRIVAIAGAYAGRTNTAIRATSTP